MRFIKDRRIVIICMAVIFTIIELIYVLFFAVAIKSGIYSRKTLDEIIKADQEKVADQYINKILSNKPEKSDSLKGINLEYSVFYDDNHIFRNRDFDNMNYREASVIVFDEKFGNNVKCATGLFSSILVDPKRNEVDKKINKKFYVNEVVFSKQDNKYYFKTDENLFFRVNCIRDVHNVIQEDGSLLYEDYDEENLVSFYFNEESGKYENIFGGIFEKEYSNQRLNLDGVIIEKELIVEYEEVDGIACKSESQIAVYQNDDSDIRLTVVDGKYENCKVYTVEYEIPDTLDFSKKDLFVRHYFLFNYLNKTKWITPIMIAVNLALMIYGIVLFRRKKCQAIQVSIILIMLVMFALNIFTYKILLGIFVFLIAAAAAVLILLELKKQLDYLRNGIDMISEGNFEYTIDSTKLIAPFAGYADKINSVKDGFNEAVTDKIQSEMFKVELITNVSHDIKTPLTSIVNYADMLSQSGVSEEEKKEYLGILSKNSMKLKRLIENLIEVSKASTGNIIVNLEPCDIDILISQITGEYEDRLKEKNINIVVDNECSGSSINADLKYIWRVFDNLMNNVYKYALEGSRLYVKVYEKETDICISLKNVTRDEIRCDAENLKERFVRGDMQRSTEGNGLGLAIADAFIESMGGRLEITLDGDIFCAIILLPKLYE